MGAPGGDWEEAKSGGDVCQRDPGRWERWPPAPGGKSSAGSVRSMERITRWRGARDGGWTWTLEQLVHRKLEIYGLFSAKSYMVYGPSQNPRVVRGPPCPPCASANGEKGHFASECEEPKKEKALLANANEDYESALLMAVACRASCRACRSRAKREGG